MPFAHRMREEGLPEIVIETFRHHYTQLLEGMSGFIEEKEIQPVASLPDMETLGNDITRIGQQAVSKTVMIKLNGGLGTSMGLNKAKSLIYIKDGFSFLDIIARQAIQSGVPLILMNSFATRVDSIQALEHYPELSDSATGLDFIQHKVPKINQCDLGIASWPQDPQLEWSPPGHGDIYIALVTSGKLDDLLAAGFEYAFISNADNLGAVLDTKLLGYFAREQIPFMMEVAKRTESDKKGGHLAQYQNGQLLLRESAQCHQEDISAFQDISRYQFFNTNNLWLNLQSLKTTLTEKNNILDLPFIRNAKTIDPRNKKSTPVYQLETAMGSAIVIFDGAQAIKVPRTRFSPVKTCNDLLLIRSDAYVLTKDNRVQLNGSFRGEPPMIDLDTRHYKLIDDLEARFPNGIPSLKNCSSLTVKGDIQFGSDITIQDNVHLNNISDSQVQIEDNKVISKNITWD
jgi:UTP--glucose-1-phosphate uridylyltransferase